MAKLSVVFECGYSPSFKVKCEFNDFDNMKNLEYVKAKINQATDIALEAYDRTHNRKN